MGKDLKGKELGENICQCKDGRYLGRYTDYYGKRHNIYGKKLKDVRDKLNKAIFESKLGVEHYDADVTLDDVYEDWIKCKYNTVKLTTCLSYKKIYKKHIKKNLGFLKINRIKTKDIESLFSNQENKSTQLLCAVIKNLFKFAIKRKYIIENPTINMIVPRTESKPTKEILNKDQQKIFVRYLEESNHKHKYIFQILLLTGLRVGELLALTWDDIDLDNGFLSVNKTVTLIKENDDLRVQSPKTKTSNRRVPLSKKAIEILNTHKKAKTGKSNIVFPNSEGKHIFISTIWRSLKDIVCDINKNGILLVETEKKEPRLFPDITPHSLRHTFATNCFEKGINAKIVQEYLGHSNIAMTMDLYTHTSDAILQSFIDLNDDVFD